VKTVVADASRGEKILHDASAHIEDLPFLSLFYEQNVVFMRSSKAEVR
jgi:hypothetical protein